MQSAEVVKARYNEIRSGFDSVGNIGALLSRVLHELQNTCPHPIDSVEGWTRIPMGHVKGECGCCGEVVWYHEYKKSDQGRVEFDVRF